MSLSGVANGTKEIQYVVPAGTAIELWYSDPTNVDRTSNIANPVQYSAVSSVTTKIETVFDRKSLISDPAGRYALINHNYPTSYIFNVDRNGWTQNGLKVWAIRIPGEGVEMKFRDI